MQPPDGIAIGEVGILRKGWYFTRKCDGWETSAIPKIAQERVSRAMTCDNDRDNALHEQNHV
jgi:hypothetical protein